MVIKNTVALLILLLSACSFSGASITRDQMNIRASQLTKLSAAVEAYARFENPSPTLGENELLRVATKDQPQLMDDFADYKLRLLIQNRHAIILVCSKNEDRALLEDAGCTGKMDVRHWENQNVPCSFTISTSTVCGLK